MEHIFGLMIIVLAMVALLSALLAGSAIMWVFEKLFPGFGDWLDEKVWGRY